MLSAFYTVANWTFPLPQETGEAWEVSAWSVLWVKGWVPCLVSKRERPTWSAASETAVVAFVLWHRPESLWMLLGPELLWMLTD